MWLLLSNCHHHHHHLYHHLCTTVLTNLLKEIILVNAVSGQWVVMLWLLWLRCIMQWTAAVLRWTCCLCTVGQVVHTLPEREDVGDVTTLAGEIYMLIRILMQEFVTEFYHWRIRAANNDACAKWLWGALEDVCTLPSALLDSVLNLYDRNTDKECLELMKQFKIILIRLIFLTVCFQLRHFEPLFTCKLCRW